ncbi:MAG: VWA domain-containing protein, partial [Pseudobutyrivibrio sp.]|nr:VWA domain-containing protein [Pseudobutyrivibrio sp.]
DENGVCKKCGYKRLPDPVLIYEDEEIIITVSGAVPENADLTVKPIKKENEETAAVYTEVENQLANESDIAEADNFGFLAYDIAFIDIESGEEVEPSGDVKVSMETKTALKPADLQEGENVEKVDVDVRHFNEQTATIDNLSDQGAATLNLDDNDAVTAAEFTSDSFSTFVITWKSSNGNTYKVNVVYSYIDTDENMVGELDTESVDWDGKTHTDLVFSDVDGLIKTFSGYTYLRAIYDKQEVDRLHFYYNSDKQARYMQIKNGDTLVDEIKLNRTESNIENVLISFIYEEDISLKVTKIATGPASQDENTTYDFVIKTKSDGSTVSGATYTVGNETFTTGADGKFTLKSLETARFKNLSPGDYVITEKAINSETYSFSSFITKTSVNDVEKTVYEETTTTERKEEVTVTGDSTVDLKFRNLYKKSNTTSQEAEVSKFITYEEDKDDYRLTMKFTPPKTDVNEIIYELDPKIETDDSKVDVVLVIDTSGSMERNNRIKNVKAAVNTMAEIFVNKPKINSRFKIVNFATNASQATDWISALELYNKVSNNVTGGTNYEAGLKEAKTVLEGARNDAKKIVIFLTDGEPTYYGTGQGAGSAFDSTALTRALTAASDITCDAFYAIGVDFSNNTYSYTHNNTTASITRRQILEMICEKVDTEETSVSTVSSEDIQELFENLASKIESVAVGDYTSNSYTYRATNVVLTDPLSE